MWCDVPVLYGSFLLMVDWIIYISYFRRSNQEAVNQWHYFATATRPIEWTTELPMDYSSNHDFYLFQNAYTGTQAPIQYL